MSTASHNWSKVLMGERSHPPCEGWQGNVAGGNGFSQSVETEGRSLGAAVPHRAVRLPRLCRRLLSEQGCRDTHCVCLFAVALADSVAPKRQECLIIILGRSYRDG